MLWLLGRSPAVRGTNLFTPDPGPGLGHEAVPPPGHAHWPCVLFEMAALPGHVSRASFSATAAAAQQIAFLAERDHLHATHGLTAATIRIGHALGEFREAARRAAEVAIAAAVGIGLPAALIPLGAGRGLRAFTPGKETWPDSAPRSCSLSRCTSLWIAPMPTQYGDCEAASKDTRGLDKLTAFGGYWLFALPSARPSASVSTELGCAGVYGFWIGFWPRPGGGGYSGALSA